MRLDAGLIFQGIVLGLGAAVPIGPVNVQIARRTLRGGFWQGFALGCGAVTVDVTYAALSSFGLRLVAGRPAVLGAVTVGGILFLSYLGVLCLRGEREAWRADPIAGGAPVGTRRGAYLTGLVMTLLNPMTLGFWFVAVPGLVGSITEEPARDLPMIGAGVFIGTVAWVVTFAGILALAGRYRRNAWLAAADAVGGVTLLGFAAAALWRSLRSVL
jgi:L-lysine exporter family protein LysE/ArgO